MSENPKSGFVSLESHLEAIQNQMGDQTWTVENLFDAMQNRGYPFLIILLSLPFCQPIQIPGFSTPFGFILMIIGLRIALARQVWWPQFILQKKIPPRVLKQVIAKSLSFIHFLKYFTSPRFLSFCENPVWYRVHGGMVFVMGLYLALPLPIPFSNLLAAWSLFFIGLGLLEDDGLFIMIGYFIAFLTIFVLSLMIFFIKNWVVASYF